MSDRGEAGRKMTKKTIMDQCKRNKLYSTPRLNDVLYLHFQGFLKIENLEEYTGLKCLWLESNAISVIEGLDHQPNLKSLFLQNNLISKIENLENCKELDTLVLSHNYIKVLENCCSSVLPVLNTLNISHNQLRNVEDLDILKRCGNISILDLSFNKIDDINIVKVLGEMPNLHVLTLTGNPIVSSITNYRKTMVLECKSLTYLDSRPVFPRDRACAEAWKRGGFAAEKREHEQWNREERRKIRSSINTMLLKARGESVLLSSSDDEKDEKPKEREEQNVNESSAMNGESSLDIYDNNQKELMKLYEQEQMELEKEEIGAGDSNRKQTTEVKPTDRESMIKQIIKDEKVEQKKDDLTKLLDISSDQDRIMQMLQMNKSIEENIFSSTTKADPPKKILIEEIVQETAKVVPQKVSFSNDIEEIPMHDDEMFSNEMESMLWFEEEPPAATTQHFDSFEYQLTNLPEVVSETFAEDYPNGPESLGNVEDLEKVLELCQEQQKDAMQLCFLNENEKLMQIYDEAVEQKLVQESDGMQLAEIEEMFQDDNDDDFPESFANLDGILMVKKIEISNEMIDDDDEDVLEFQNIEISEVRRTAENLIDGVIKSLEDIDMSM